MDYDLCRIDYFITGITYPDTLKILPSHGQKLEQKIVIGDKTGILQCLSIRDEEPIVQFKTLPGKSITAVQLASTNGLQPDKIFAASGNEVKGYTKKGKVFFSIETALSDPVTSMSVFGGDLILCSGRTITFYRDSQEHQSYVCEDRILDMSAFIAPNNAKVRLLLLIAHKGAGILENGHLIAHIAISSGPSRLATPPIAHIPEIKCFYGAADGSIGLITYEESVLSSNRLVEGRGLGSVVCLGWFNANGNFHLAVGRQDGSIQLYLIDIENLQALPRLKFTYFSGEPVTSVVGGCVGTDEGELLVATFSGRIFALRSKSLISGSMLTKGSHENLAARRSKLEIEIVRLEKQATNEREKYQRNSRSLQAGLSTPPLLDVEHKVSGASKEGWQEIDITSAVPLDMLFIYCSKKLELSTDSAAVLSVCGSQSTASDLLATVRCQAGTRRIWVRMRLASKGFTILESTRVLVYALPTGAPRVARLLSVKLPALPYYSQYGELNVDDDKTSSWCQLHVTGSFSVAEMTSWLTEILPGDLPRPASNIAFVREHTFIGTKLACQYQRGSAVFKSNNITTISSMRSIISNCSIEKRIRVEITCDIPDDCCLRSFKLIEKILYAEYEKNKNLKLKKALNMLDLDNTIDKSEEAVLCAEYETAFKSSSENQISETFFDDLIEIVLQWYLDWRSLSLHGNSTSDESNKLRMLLNEFQIDDIIKLFTKFTESTVNNEFE